MQRLHAWLGTSAALHELDGYCLFAVPPLCAGQQQHHVWNTEIRLQLRLLHTAFEVPSQALVASLITAHTSV